MAIGRGWRRGQMFCPKIDTPSGGSFVWGHIWGEGALVGGEHWVGGGTGLDWKKRGVRGGGSGNPPPEGGSRIPPFKPHPLTATGEKSKGEEGRPLYQFWGLDTFPYNPGDGGNPEEPSPFPPPSPLPPSSNPPTGIPGGGWTWPQMTKGRVVAWTLVRTAELQMVNRRTTRRMRAVGSHVSDLPGGKGVGGRGETGLLSGGDTHPGLEGGRKSRGPEKEGGR